MITMDQAAYDAKMKDLLSRRVIGIKNMQIFLACHHAEGSERTKQALIDSQNVLRLVNEALAEMGEISRRMEGGGVAKTKRELIGALMVWADQMADANKNPATSPGGKLFNQRAVERIAQILKANGPSCDF